MPIHDQIPDPKNNPENNHGHTPKILITQSALTLREFSTMLAELIEEFPHFADLAVVANLDSETNYLRIADMSGVGKDDLTVDNPTLLVLTVERITKPKPEALKAMLDRVARDLPDLPKSN